MPAGGRSRVERPTWWGPTCWRRPRAAERPGRCAWEGEACMLGSGPPRDGIIRTSPGQECSKDKGALPGARRISVYAFRFWSRARHIPSRWFTSRCLILCLVAERVSLYPAKRRCARSSMDRASDYGSEGWGFESLRARSGPPRCDPPVGVLHLWTAPLRGCFSIARPALAVVPRLLGLAAFDAGALSFRAGGRAGGCKRRGSHPHR